MTGKFKLIRAFNPFIVESYKILLKAEKFRNWKPERTQDAV
jgi:hypothetical protein